MLDTCPEYADCPASRFVCIFATVDGHLSFSRYTPSQVLEFQALI